MAVTDPIPAAVLQYVDHGSYPDSEDVASARLESTNLSSLLKELRKAQDEVKNDVRTLSKRTAPDVDEWISKARGLQQDILRSRDTARQIVAEHEAGRELKAKVQDKDEQLKLLEKEVAFEETLGATLEHIRHANGVLQCVQDEAVSGNLQKALDSLETAQESIGGLDGVRDTKAVGLLHTRADKLRGNLCENAAGRWSQFVAVNVERRTLALSNIGPGQKLIGVEDLAKVSQRLGIFDDLLKKLSRDIERAIIKPRLSVSSKGQVAKLQVREAELSCTDMTEDLSYASLFRDLEQCAQYLSSNLPASIAVPLSSILIPAMTERLEQQWLEPAVPLEVSEMPAFQDNLTRVQNLAETIEQHGWQGAKQLRDWVQNAPRTWLTKRREAVLGDVRNLVFTGLRETKLAERVETQMVSSDDQQALQGEDGMGEDEDWDTAWDEPEEAAKPEAKADPHSESKVDEDDEASAWDLDDMDESKSAKGDGGEDDEGDAWGWGDEENKPASPTIAKQSPSQTPQASASRPAATQQPVQQEMTLRETFTVTLVPDELLEILQNIIADAQTLAGPDYSSSPIAPAATALYTLPTLALAIYRATAPTAYAKLPTGNMLIYNDASHLSNKLKEWQASQPAASRLRLDADVKALETFAKKAYSSEMESQRTILRDLLDGAGGFSNVTKPPFKAECESAVQQTVDRLRDVQSLWKDVLSDGALDQSLGSLLSTVTAKMIGEVEDLGDIGEEDSHQLRHLMDIISSSAKDIFTKTAPTGEEQDMTFVYCPNWLKLQYLAEILESSLVDIKYLWNEGELSLEFDAEEVCELIEGLFADSDVRRKTMAEIRRSGR